MGNHQSDARKTPRRIIALIAIVLGGCSKGAPVADDPARVAPAVFAPAFPDPVPVARRLPDDLVADDASCAACHPAIASSYAQHSMGRSLAPIADAAGPEGPASAVAFEAGGLTYSIERRGADVVHAAARGDQTRAEALVRYALGSGVRGVSYLVERGDGFLTQSPISWYAQEGRYDLAPGYASDPLLFERPINAECLACHAGAFEPLAGPTNAYAPPVFRQHAIGCERCHGPSRRHVEAEGNLADDQPGPTVVNPAKLEPFLREAVCQQCHLQGETRVARRGKSALDFQPGQPLADAIVAFVKAGPNAGGVANRAVGQTEQMEASRCYRESDGRMGCTSCHDPHSLPKPEAKVAYYRSKCLDCHADRACALPEPARLERSPADDCVACHMPRRGLADIAHTASTLHHVPRQATADDLAPIDPAFESLAPAQPPYLAEWHGELRGDDDRARDLGVALATAAREQGDPASAAGMARLALAKLDPALRTHPDDARAHEARASALMLLGRSADSLEALEAALKLDPREEPLSFAVGLANRLGRPDDALAKARALVKLNPWRANHHAALAALLAQRNDWPAALESAEAALQLNPEDPATRRVAIAALEALGRSDEAERERDAASR